MKKLSLYVLISIFAMPQLAHAGAWTLPKNNVWVEHYTKFNWADDDFDTKYNRHTKSNNAKSWGWSMNPKAEYGVTDWFTVFGGVEYKEAKYKEYARPPEWGPYSVKNHAFTSFDFGGRVRFLEEPVVVSGQVKANYYTGYDEGKSGVGGQPALGDRNDYYEFKALLGKFFDQHAGWPFYLGLESGYRLKNRYVGDEIPLFVEGGFWPYKWLLLKGEIDSYFGLNGTGEILKDAMTFRVGPVFQLVDIYEAISGNDITNGDFSSDITRQDRSLNLSLQYGNTFWGRNVSADQELILKLSGQF